MNKFIGGHVSTKTAPKNDESYTTVNPGPYIGVVKDNRDINRMGSLTVNIPSLSGSDDPPAGQLTTVQYLAPFYGAKSPAATRPSGVAEYEDSQHSYGFWAVPPDIDSKVLVIFAEGNMTQGFWIGCVQDTYTNHMVPGLASSNDTFSPASDGDFSLGKEQIFGTSNVPAGEANRSLYAEASAQGVDRLKKPIHPFSETLRQQGLIQDTVRGTTSSSARRETPSRVFGMSTPGRENQLSSKTDKLGPKGEKRDLKTTRSAGHTFVMDDGDVQGDNQLIRFRSASGHQILLHDTEGVVYIANGSGNAWMEFDSSGSIDIYSGGTMAVRAKGDLNLHSDSDINMFAGKRIRMRSLDKMVLDGGSITQYSDTDIQQHASTGSITSKVPRGSILSYAQQSQIHQSSGVHHLTGSEVHFNSINTDSNFFADVERTNTFSPTGTNTILNSNQDVDTRQKGSPRPLEVNSQGMVTMSGMRTPTHEPWIHWNQTKFAVGFEPSNNDNVPGTPQFIANRNRNSDSQIIRDAQFQADLQLEIDKKKDQHKNDPSAIRKIADAFTKTYNQTYSIPDGIGASLPSRSDIINQTIDSVTGSSVNLLKDQVFVNKSGVLYTAGNLNSAISGTTSGVLNDLSKGIGVFTTAGNVLSDTQSTIEGIVPRSGNVGNVINTVNTVTNTYKNVVSGQVVGVTQIKSVVSTVGSTVAKVGRSIGKIFGF